MGVERALATRDQTRNGGSALMSRAVPIDELMTELGFRTPELRQRARTVLEQAQLTNTRKQNISSAKREAVERVLGERFVLVCARASCRHAAGTAREVLHASRPTDCGVCGGQQNRAEVDRAIAALAARGMRRLVVVGGSPGTHDELRGLVVDSLELRIVSGTDRRTGRDAKADLAWADLVVVWGATELKHKVSKLYTDGKPRHVVTCPKRGIGALAGTIVEAVRRR